MNIDKILLEICKHLGKEATYKGTLKRTYNQIDKDHTAGGLKDMLPDNDAYERINLLGVLKKYKIAPEHLDSFIEEEEEFEIEELEDFEEEIEDFEEEDLEAFEIIEAEPKTIEKNGLIITNDPEYGAPTPQRKPEAWQSLFNTVSTDNRNADGEYEKIPSLRLVDNATYYLKLTEPEVPADPKNITDSWGNEQVKYILKVQLVKVSPSEMYDMAYERGDFKGHDCFVDGGIYNLWLEEDRMFKPFVRMWRDTLGVLPDKRTFTLRKTKKLSKNNRWYNVFKFGTPKKRK